jgi:hypothetical protein
MLLVARMTATSLVDCKHDSNLHTFLRRIAKSDNDKLWLIVTEECEIAPSNNLPNFYVALQEQATIRKR